MARTPLLLVTLACAACQDAPIDRLVGSDVGPIDAGSGSAEDAGFADGGAPTDQGIAPVDGGAMDLSVMDAGPMVCRGSGGLDFSVRSQGLVGVDGAQVWVVALENVPDETGSESRFQRATLLADRVDDGHFDLGCEAALTPNANYPTLMTLVDANRDGVCSPGDWFVMDAFFAWGAGEHELEPERFTIYQPEQAPPLPIGSADVPFCAHFD